MRAKQSFIFKMLLLNIIIPSCSCTIIIIIIITIIIIIIIIVKLNLLVIIGKMFLILYIKVGWERLSV